MGRCESVEHAPDEIDITQFEADIARRKAPSGTPRLVGKGSPTS